MHGFKTRDKHQKQQTCKSKRLFFVGSQSCKMIPLEGSHDWLQSLLTPTCWPSQHCSITNECDAEQTHFTAQKTKLHEMKNDLLSKRNDRLFSWNFPIPSPLIVFHFHNGITFKLDLHGLYAPRMEDRGRSFPWLANWNRFQLTVIFEVCDSINDGWWESQCSYVE